MTSQTRCDPTLRTRTAQRTAAARTSRGDEFSFCCLSFFRFA